MRTHKKSCIIADNHDVILDVDLYNIVRGLSAKQRLAMAKKFANWSAQITASARQMDSSIADANTPAPAKIPKGFILINMAAWEKERLYKMAKECRIPLRQVFGYSLLNTREWLEGKLKLMRTTGLSIPEQAGFFTYKPEKN